MRVPGLKFLPLAAPGGRPPAAVEFFPAGVLAAATPSPGAAPAFSFAPLPHGALLPALREGNVANPTAVAAAVRTALAAVSPRTRAVTVVVPDVAARVFLLDFDTWPARQEDALAVLRFRLRKSVPFDAEEAAVSYQVLTEGSARSEAVWRILAVITPGKVLAEYEAAIRAAGYEPGVVLPASLAALPLLDEHEARLVVHLADESLSTTIVSGNDLLLARTVELSPEIRSGLAPEIGSGIGPEIGSEIDAEIAHHTERNAAIQRAIAVAAAFFEDRFQTQATRVQYTGPMPIADFRALIADAADAALEVEELFPAPEISITTSLRSTPVASLLGALRESR